MLTVSARATLSVTLPEVPVTVMRYVPAATEALAAKVIVEVPAPVIEVGLKVTVTPAGWPVADNEMAELKPLSTVLAIVDLPVPPCSTETVVGEAVRPNPGVLIAPRSALSRLLPFGLPQPVARS